MVNKALNYALVVSASVVIVLGTLLLSKAPTSQSPVTNLNITTPPSINSGDQVRILPVENAAEKKVEVLKVTPEKKRVLQLNKAVFPESINPLISEMRKLDKDNKPIYLLINSPGGSVLSGAGLISQMEGMKSPVYTVCTELCASMAAFIHQYGTKRYATNRAILMFHPASGGAQGQIKNNLSRMSFIDNYVEKFNKYVINRSKFDKNEYDKLVSYEFWIDAEDSLKKGLLDNVVSLDIDLDTPSAPSTEEERHKSVKEDSFVKELRDVQ